jgi:hypothetical protein
MEMPMTLSPEQRVAETEKTLQREQRLHIWMPFAVGVLALLLLVVVAALTPRVSVVANCMMTILILCPVLICLLPIYFLMVFAVYGMNGVYNGAAIPLRRLEKLSQILHNRTISLSDTLARQSININARLAPLTHKMEHAFDERKDDHEQSDTGQ